MNDNSDAMHRVITKSERFIFSKYRYRLWADYIRSVNGWVEFCYVLKNDPYPALNCAMLEKPTNAGTARNPNWGHRLQLGLGLTVV